MYIYSYIHICAIILQLNTSGCDCLPNDCDKANREFELLKQSTEYCFHDGNNPINNVAHQIKNDARHLHYIIKQLESYDEIPDVMECSFSFKAIKKVIAVDDKWCNY